MYLAKAPLASYGLRILNRADGVQNSVVSLILEIRRCESPCGQHFSSFLVGISQNSDQSSDCFAILAVVRAILSLLNLVRACEPLSLTGRRQAQAGPS